MSLRLPSPVTTTDVRPDLPTVLAQANSIQDGSAKRIPALLPSVKSAPSIGEWLNPATLPPGSSLVITTTQTQVVVHPLRAMGDRLPLSLSKLSESEDSHDPSIAVRDPVPPEDWQSGQTWHNWQKYLNHLVILSFGAALGTLLHGDLGTSLSKSDRDLAPKAISLPLDEEAQAFIQKAQQTLYHLDRLAIQAERNPAPPTLPPSAVTENLPQETNPVVAWGGTVLDIPPPPSWPAEAEAPIEYPVSTIEGEKSLRIAPIPPQLSRWINTSGTPGMSSDPLYPQEAELIGLLEQGEQSIALLKVQGRVQQVSVGDRLANGMTFVGAESGQAILGLENDRFYLTVGQKF